MQEKMPEKQPENLDMEMMQAYASIMSMSHAIMQMGSTDNSEKEKMEDILKRLKEKKISPQDALTEAGAVLNSKQDYH